MTRTSRRTAVVTGIGLLTPLGRGTADVFDGLCTGRSGLCRPEGDKAVPMLDVAGLAPPVDPLSVLPRAEARSVDRYLLLALAAAEDAVADAGLLVGENVASERVAVTVSSGAGGLSTFEEQSVRRSVHGRTVVSPFLLPGMLPNMAAARIAIKFGIRGYSSAIATACAAGAQSVADGLRLIREGQADVVICGGAEAPLNPTSVAAFTNSRALARDWAEPQKASRPFDRRRNGFVLAEGAAVLVLERPEHADARKAAGYADVIGWSASTDAFHPTSPRPDGESAAAAIRGSLADAGAAASDVRYVNAHATGTKLGDAAEAAALRAVFGEDGVPAVSSTKGSTGHLIGAAGALEAAITVLALSRRLLPPTRNLEEPDPACALDHIVAEGRPLGSAAAIALSNSFAFGGHNVSLVFGEPSSGDRRGGQAVGGGAGGGPSEATELHIPGGKA